MVRLVAPAEIIGAANAAPTAPMSTPMQRSNKLHKWEHILRYNNLAIG